MADTKFEVFKRSDGRWAWHLMGANHFIIATDGGQGYENREDALVLGWGVVAGAFKPDGGRPA